MRGEGGLTDSATKILTDAMISIGVIFVLLILFPVICVKRMKKHSSGHVQKKGRSRQSIHLQRVLRKPVVAKTIKGVNDNTLPGAKVFIILEAFQLQYYMYENLSRCATWPKVYKEYMEKIMVAVSLDFTQFTLPGCWVENYSYYNTMRFFLFAPIFVFGLGMLISFLQLRVQMSHYDLKQLATLTSNTLGIGKDDEEIDAGVGAIALPDSAALKRAKKHRRQQHKKQMHPGRSTSVLHGLRISRKSMKKNLTKEKYEAWLKSRAKQMNVIKGKVLHSCVAIIIVAYPAVTRRLLQFFICREIDHKYYMECDYSLQCFDDTWFENLPSVLGGVIVYTLGIPVTFVIQVQYD